jgi:hypothetical protein
VGGFIFQRAKTFRKTLIYTTNGFMFSWSTHFYHFHCGYGYFYGFHSRNVMFVNKQAYVNICSLSEYRPMGILLFYDL